MPIRTPKGAAKRPVPTPMANRNGTWVLPPTVFNSDIPSSELIMLDRSYYRSWPRHEIEFIGCDLSKPAVDYARAVGLIKHGLVGNFEVQPLPGTAEEILRGVDLIISTGSIGYVTERTIGRLLAAIGKPAPWIASFVLRMFPYDRIEESLSAAGLVTEKMQGITFVQRRFQRLNSASGILVHIRDPECVAAAAVADNFSKDFSTAFFRVFERL